MTHVITRGCCTDASCVSVCPVDCIHPRPGEPDYGKTEILYVDADVCIDCGACADACPVKAIKPADLLSGDELVFLDINAEYYRDRVAPEVPWEHTWDLMGPARQGDPLRVAVVGTGPSASYLTRSLLLSTESEVTILDKARLPGGFVRAAVAPDHGGTKNFAEMFDWLHRHPRTRMFMNVEVGKDLTHAELLAFHDAVIYAVGADRDVPLGIPGEELAGVHAAHEVVRWYNADDTVSPADVELSPGRVVIVGNGNVALDIARILLSDPGDLRNTEIAPEALREITLAGVREVVLLGRRGPEEAAFTRPELLMMPPGVEVVVQSDNWTEEQFRNAEPDSKAALLNQLERHHGELGEIPAPGRRLVLCFGSSLTEVIGKTRAERARVSTTGDNWDIPVGTVVRSIGHRGSPVSGLPFDDQAGTVPNDAGRVIDPVTGVPVPGAYVVGWIKRGATGGIGVNKNDAQETMLTLLKDSNDPANRRAVGSARAFSRHVKRNVPEVLTRRKMAKLDAAEKRAGEALGRPRVKNVPTGNW